MSAKASSSSCTQGDTYFDPIGTNENPTDDQAQLGTERTEVESSMTLLELIDDQTQPRTQPQPQPSLDIEKITLEAKIAKKDKQLKAARQELSKISGEKTKLKQEVMNFYHPSYPELVLYHLWDSTNEKNGASYKRRFHDLGAESSGSIAKEPERIKFPKRTVLGIIQNQGGNSVDQSRDRPDTEAEKIKLKRRAQARAHISRLDQLERENKRLKAALEKRDGQIKKLVNADKENRNSRHFGNAESREAGFRPPPGFHRFS